MTENTEMTGPVKNLRNFVSNTLCRAASLALGCGLLCSQSTEAAQGDRDTTFGQNGCTAVGYADLGLNFSKANSLAIQNLDGKIVVAGQANNSSHSAFALARLNAADGSLDTTFGSGGRVLTTFNLNLNGATFDLASAASAIAVQSDGKILAAGTALSSLTQSSANSMAVARYTTAGILDTNFGIGGKVTASVGTNGNISSMVLQSDGKIVVAGTVVRPGTGSDFLVTRLLSSGGLDTTFGATLLPNLTGSVTADMGGQESANAVIMQPDGKIVVAGNTRIPGLSSFAVARFAANGRFDNTFGGIGRVTTDFPGSTNASANAIAIQSDGKIVLAGSVRNGAFLSIPTHGFALTRYTTNGVLDSTFGTGGRVITSILAPGASEDTAFAVVVQPDGKIVVAGSSAALALETGTSIALVRYNSNGSLDTTFGNSGKVLNPCGNAAFDIAKQMMPTLIGNGRLVVAGEFSQTGSSQMAMARFIGFSTQLIIP